MPRRRSAFLARTLLAALLLASGGAGAAEFRKEAVSGMGDIIEVEGDLRDGDDRKFADLALTSRSAMVVFHSRGGNLMAGIEIGRAIRLKRFATYVPDDMMCASACALAWLGGRVRAMSATGRVGFHAVYVSDNGRPSTSSDGNAVVGAYLNQLGLPMEAVIYITKAAPGAMQWLSFEDAPKVGIAVERLDVGSSGPRPFVDARPPAAPRDSEAEAAKATLAFFEATGRGNDAALVALTAMYADVVDYYGSVRSLREVVADKTGFFRRWPSRVYAVKEGTLEVNCSDDAHCTCAGAFKYDAVNAASRSTGASSFQHGWVRQGSVWRLVRENGTVFARDVRPR